MKSFLIYAPLIIILIFVVGCNNSTQPDSTIPITNRDISITYIGQSDSTHTAMFKLNNTLSDTIEYGGYSYNNLFCNTQFRDGDNWDYLFHNWCGTGVESFYLVSSSSIDFAVSLPYEPCTWRVELWVTNVNTDSSFYVYSDEIVYW